MQRYPRQTTSKRSIMRSRLAAPIAVLAFVVGVVAWALLLGWVVTAVKDAFREDDGPVNGDVVIEPTDNVDCDDFDGSRTPTPDEANALVNECTTPTPVTPTATSMPKTPTATANQAPTDENRFNCSLIRGTDYRSPNERTWFLENCLTPTP
jgi:hypothetical protein